MGPIQMHNPKEPEGHRDMSVPPERVQEFIALGWQIAGAESAAAPDAEPEQPTDARRKPRKVAEQS